VNGRGWFLESCGPAKIATTEISETIEKKEERKRKRRRGPCCIIAPR